MTGWPAADPVDPVDLLDTSPGYDWPEPEVPCVWLVWYACYEQVGDLGYFTTKAQAEALYAEWAPLLMGKWVRGDCVQRMGVSPCPLDEPLWPREILTDLPVVPLDSHQLRDHLSEMEDPPVMTNSTTHAAERLAALPGQPQDPAKLATRAAQAPQTPEPVPVPQPKIKSGLRAPWRIGKRNYKRFGDDDASGRYIP